MKDTILYSQATEISYKINQKYYNDTHYVWCAEEPLSGYLQAGTSDPMERCNRILTAIYSGDCHEHLIEENKKGIRLGALLKKKEGIITEEQEEEIIALLRSAELSDFSPVLYIIPFELVKDNLEIAPDSQKASSTSVEYIIRNLKHYQFDVIHFDDAINLKRILRNGK